MRFSGKALYCLLTCAAAILWTAPVHAAFDRHAVDGYGLRTERVQGYQRTRHKQAAKKHNHNGQRLQRVALKAHGIAPRIVAHPEGCPRRAFCGCGVALKVFGKHVRSLWLAANWRRYRHAEPGPGKVAWRQGHVFYIERLVRNGYVLAYDPNSGRGLTRIHVRSLAGYRVVDPRG